MRPIPIENTQEADPNRLLAELISHEEDLLDAQERHDREKEQADADV